MKDEQITEALKDLKREVEDQNKATRGHVSAVFDGIAHNTEVTKLRVTDLIDQQTRDAKEFREDLTEHRTRLYWLIGVVGKLNAALERVHQWMKGK